jgi:hypothetical protein
MRHFLSWSTLEACGPNLTPSPPVHSSDLGTGHSGWVCTAQRPNNSPGSLRHAGVSCFLQLSKHSKRFLPFYSLAPSEDSEGLQCGRSSPPTSSPLQNKFTHTESIWREYVWKQKTRQDRNKTRKNGGRECYFK